MYNLVDPETMQNLDQSYELVDLFKKLDSYTAKNRKVVIIKDGEVKAGNLIAFEYAGKQL
jgi:hypothetical protein